MRVSWRSRIGFVARCTRCRFDIQKSRRLFCPTSQAYRAKIFVFPKRSNYDLTKPSRPHEGRFAIVTIRGAGCDGRGRAARRAARARTVKPCGPDSPALGSSCSERSARRRWLQSPTHRRERGVSRKAIAQGVPDVSALPDFLVCISTFQHTRLRVRPVPGIPCALCFRG